MCVAFLRERPINAGANGLGLRPARAGPLRLWLAYNMISHHPWRATRWCPHCGSVRPLTRLFRRPINTTYDAYGIRGPRPTPFTFPRLVLLLIDGLLFPDPRPASFFYTSATALGVKAPPCVGPLALSRHTSAVREPLPASATASCWPHTASTRWGCRGPPGYISSPHASCCGRINSTTSSRTTHRTGLFLDHNRDGRPRRRSRLWG